MTGGAVPAGAVPGGPGTPEGDAPVDPVVAVTRTLGGLVLLIVGVVLLAGGAFAYFVAPLVAPFAGGVWDLIADLDLVAALVGGIGLVLVVVGWAIVRRAGKRDLGIRFGTPENVDEALGGTPPGT